MLVKANGTISRHIDFQLTLQLSVGHLLEHFVHLLLCFSSLAGAARQSERLPAAADGDWWSELCLCHCCHFR